MVELGNSPCEKGGKIQVTVPRSVFLFLFPLLLLYLFLAIDICFLVLFFFFPSFFEYENLMGRLMRLAESVKSK